MRKRTKSGWRRERCLCDICVRISPMQKRIRNALPKELKKDFDYLYMRMVCAEEDLAASDAKLRGQWTGWEWIKDARVKAEGRVAAQKP